MFGENHVMENFIFVFTHHVLVGCDIEVVDMGVTFAMRGSNENYVLGLVCIS